MGTLEEAAKQAVENCVRVQPNEFGIIITDEKTYDVASALYHAANNITEFVNMAVMEDYGDRPEDGSNPLQFPDELADLMIKADFSFYAAVSKDGELESFRKPMLLDTHLVNPNLRHAHMPDVTEEVIRIGMSANYEEIGKLTAKVAEIMRQARFANVLSPAGTDLFVEFHPEWKWWEANGIIKPGKWSNLPDGETFTCAYNADGIIVVDGVIGDHFDSKYGLIEDTPVTIEIANGRIVNILGDNKELVLELIRYTQKDENADRLGEFALGTNYIIEELIGNALLDEKIIGVHAAIGDGIPSKTGADWESGAHADCIFQRATVYADGALIMKDGVYQI